MKKFSLNIVLYPVLPIILLFALNVCMLWGVEETSPKTLQDTRFPSFTTQDIYGNIVTEDIFKGKFSVVYIWMTDAGNINSIMRDLMIKLSTAKNTPIQLVGIVGDVKEGNATKIALAKRLTNNFSPDMIQILPNDDMMPFLQNVHNVPFVCFVDEDGNFVGQPIVGNEPELAEKEANRLLAKNTLAVETAAKVQQGLFGRP